MFLKINFDFMANFVTVTTNFKAFASTSVKRFVAIVSWTTSKVWFVDVGNEFVFI